MRCRLKCHNERNPCSQLPSGDAGLYYFYDIMARALSASGVEKVGEHDWRRELAAKLMSLQKPDGSWSNENNRFWESDPILCTSFAVLVLEHCRLTSARP